MSELFTWVLWLVYKGYVLAFLLGAIAAMQLQIFKNARQIRRNSETIRRNSEAIRQRAGDLASRRLDAIDHATWLRSRR